MRFEQCIKVQKILSICENLFSREKTTKELHCIHIYQVIYCAKKNKDKKLMKI